MEPAETLESQAITFVPGPTSSSCSRCLQACRVSLRSCRYIFHGHFDGDGGYFRCELDRSECVNTCRYVCH